MAKGKRSGEDASVRTLKEDLKQKAPRRLYVLYGEETYLRDYYFDRLREQVVPQGMEAFNLKALDGKTCGALDIVKACDCLPMMSERTLVAVTDYDLLRAPAQDREELAELFESLPDYLTLVFVYDTVAFEPRPAKEEKPAEDKGGGKGREDKGRALLAALKAQGLAVHFTQQAQEDLVNWVARHFKAAGRDIDLRDADYLVFLCGGLMQNLSSEIEKIAAYAPGKRVTRGDIDAVATPQLDAKIYALTDAVSARSGERALTALGELLRGEEVPTLVAALDKHLRQLYAARVILESHRGAGELSGLWKTMHSYTVSKLMSAAQRVDLSWCRRALVRTAQTDLAAKSGADGPAALTQLVLELCCG